MAASSLDGKLLVIAIDFGTAYSGYAFSFRQDYRLDPLKIEVNHWTGEGAQTMSPKAPTSLLLNPDKTFHSFGYEAEEKYASLVENGNHENWFYFTQIKMKLLHKQHIKRDVMIDDECGKQMSGMTVVSHILRHLKDKALKTLDDRNLKPRDEDILWVLTVPAIWSDAAKQFTKEAAEEAGLRQDDILFAYEPEAAALYCRLVDLNNVNASNSKQNKDGKDTLTTGRTILVFDIGGGTTDISVIRFKSKNEIHILDKASGGAFGGTTINAEFQRFLEKFFGENVFNDFKTKHRSDYILLFRQFEERKRDIKPTGDRQLILRIPNSLKKSAEKSWGKKLKEYMEISDMKDTIKIVQRDKMSLSPETVCEKLVLPITNNIVTEMKKVIDKHANISSILVVGGLSQSQIVTSEIRKCVQRVPVYIPLDSSLSVLNGAVLYGHDRNVIKARICKYSYGVQTMKRFEPRIHDENKKVVQEGETWCKDCFRALYRANESIKLGDIRSHELHESFSDKSRQQKRFNSIKCVLFVTENPNPKYIDEEGCKEHGEIEIFPPSDGFRARYDCTIEMEFAGTEIIARVKDKKETKSLRLDFMT